MTAIGNAGGLNKFLAVCRAMHRANWDVLCSAAVVNDYNRVGFGLESITSSLDYHSAEWAKYILYPNHSTGVICFKPNEQSISNIEVINLHGQRSTLMLEEGAPCFRIPENLNGFILVRYTKDGKRYQGKILIHRLSWIGQTHENQNRSCSY